MDEINQIVQGEARPNAYVLFLTCLIGAVFSELVWSRARDWFSELKQRSDSEREDDETPADDEAPAADKGVPAPV